MTDQIVDLKILAAVTIVTTVVIASGLGSGTPIAVLVAAPLLLFVPGYAILAALLPSSRPASQPSSSTPSITGLEWWILSVSISAVIVPAVAISVVATPLEFGPATLASLLGIVSGGATAVAARRRKHADSAARRASDLSFVAPIRRAFRLNSPKDIVLSVALVASVLLVAASGLYALSAEPHQSEYTELYLLTGDDAAEYEAGGFPTEIESGEELTVSVGVENHEGTPREYIVVVQEQRLDGDEIVDRSERDRFSVRLRDGETEITTHAVEPAAERGSVKIAYLLFRTDADDIPETPTEADAYRRAYVRLEVQPTDAGGASTVPPELRIYV